eukprot:8351972-Alexandrium_andersonii.AAC.1
MGCVPQTCHESMNRNSSARAASTSSRGRACPVMSSRYGVAPLGRAATVRPRVASLPHAFCS